MTNLTKVNIIRDNECSLHPLHDFDNLGCFALDVKNYNIGDRNYIQTLRQKIENSNLFRQKYYNEYDLSNPRDLKKLGEKLGLFAVNITVYGYLHSGLALSLERSGQFTCPFDSGVAGFIYVTKDDIRQYFNVRRVTKKHIEKATEILKAEFSLLKEFVEGNCFAFEIFDDQDNPVDYCGGFIGANIETNGMLDYIPEHLHEQAREKIATV